MAIITLLTDFGTSDGYPAVMKGVIMSIARSAAIVDISHEVPPQDIITGALILERTVPYFPAGTIHVGVVDPGVGTARRAVAVRIGKSYFVGPDNGLATLLLERAEAHREVVESVVLDQSTYQLTQVSAVFHGRDIFAPAAAHLARGIHLANLGTPIRDVMRLPFPKPRIGVDLIEGIIIHVDHFGNLATNITMDHLSGRQVLAVGAKNLQIAGLSAAYGSHRIGEPAALIDSSGRLSIAVVNGNAKTQLNLERGDIVKVQVKPD